MRRKKEERGQHSAILTKQALIHKGYYTVARRYEFYALATRT